MPRKVCLGWWRVDKNNRQSDDFRGTVTSKMTVVEVRQGSHGNIKLANLRRRTDMEFIDKTKGFNIETKGQDVNLWIIEFLHWKVFGNDHVQIIYEDYYTTARVN